MRVLIRLGLPLKATLKHKPRTDAERSKLLEQVKERVENLTLEQKAEAMKRRAPSSASPKDSAKG